MRESDTTGRRPEDRIPQLRAAIYAKGAAGLAGPPALNASR